MSLPSVTCSSTCVTPCCAPRRPAVRAAPRRTRDPVPPARPHAPDHHPSGSSGGRQPPPMATAVPSRTTRTRVARAETRPPRVLGLRQDVQERHAEGGGRVGEGAQPDLAEVRQSSGETSTIMSPAPSRCRTAGPRPTAPAVGLSCRPGEGERVARHGPARRPRHTGSIRADRPGGRGVASLPAGRPSRPPPRRGLVPHVTPGEGLRARLRGRAHGDRGAGAPPRTYAGVAAAPSAARRRPRRSGTSSAPAAACSTSGVNQTACAMLRRRSATDAPTCGPAASVQVRWTRCCTRAESTRGCSGAEVEPPDGEGLRGVRLAAGHVASTGASGASA